MKSYIYNFAVMAMMGWEFWVVTGDKFAPGTIAAMILVINLAANICIIYETKLHGKTAGVFKRAPIYMILGAVAIEVLFFATITVYKENNVGQVAAGLLYAICIALAVTYVYKIIKNGFQCDYWSNIFIVWIGIILYTISTTGIMNSTILQLGIEVSAGNVAILLETVACLFISARVTAFGWDKRHDRIS